MTTTLPSAGLCTRAWCVEHELTDYGHGDTDSMCFGVLNESHSMHGGIYLAITHNGDDVPGVLLAAPDLDRDLWHSPAELRQFAGLLLNAADALDAAQNA